MEIPLTKGKVATVDDGDYALVAPYSWRAKKANRTWYASTQVTVSTGTRKHIDMHALIMGGSTTTKTVDHVNGNGLDNRRDNLRFATRAGQARNRSRPITNTSGFKGVTLHRQTGKWQAQIKVGTKSFYLGLFTEAADAASAYDAKARELFGGFARGNFA